MAHLQLMQLLHLTITSLTSLFAALIAVNGTLHDSGLSGHGNRLVVMTKMLYNT